MSINGKTGPSNGTISSQGSHVINGGGFDVKLLPEGNLVYYAGGPTWASMSQGIAHQPYKLAVEEDGIIHVYGTSESSNEGFVSIWDSKGTGTKSSSGMFTSSAGKNELPSEVLMPDDPSPYVTWLQVGEALVSSNNQYKFVNQADGNQCVYQSGKCTWASQAWHRGAGNLYMQRDGNLVLYNTQGNGAPVWSSKTTGKGPGPYKLIMEDDGNLVIQNSKSEIIWVTGVSSTLGAGSSTLRSGQSLTSPSKAYTFKNQDGILRVYNERGDITWASASWGNGRGDLKLMTDGNVVVYDTESTGLPLWATMSQVGKGPEPFKLIVQDDGDVVVGSPVVWGTKTDKSSGRFKSVAGKSEMCSEMLPFVTWLQTGDALVSPNQKFTFINQQDGNLCVYDENKVCLWACGQYYERAGNAYLQRDGNLALYHTGGNGDGILLWSSESKGSEGPYKLIMQDNGILVIQNKFSETTWASSIFSLPPNTILHVGESVLSSNERYKFVNQADGNLVVYENKKALWASGSWEEGVGDVTLLAEGNLVLYDTKGTGLPVWASMWQSLVKPAGPYKLVVQDAGNLVIIGAGSATPIWDSQKDTSASRPTGLFTPVAGTSEMRSNAVSWLRTYDMLVSSNGRYKLINQGDGDVCIYTDRNVIWKSRTCGKGAGNLYLEADGNVVLYNTKGDGARIGCSGTSNLGTGPYKLILLDEGHLVIHDSTGHCTWASNTTGSHGFVDH